MEKVKWNSFDKKQNGLKYSKNDKSSVVMNSYSLVYMLHFVSAVKPKEIARNKIPKFEVYSSGVNSPEAVDELHNRTLRLQSIHCPLRWKWI